MGELAQGLVGAGVSWCGLPTGVPCAAGAEEDGGEEMRLGRLELGAGSSRTARRC
jgi:hypothetical protein